MAACRLRLRLALAGAAVVVAFSLLGCGSPSSVSLVYRAASDGHGQAASRAALQQAAVLIRTRLRASGVASFAVAVSGDRLTLTVPAGDASDRVPVVVEIGQVGFYDWEANVIGPRGQPAPADPSVTGGENAGGAECGLPLYQAVMRAAARPPVTPPAHAASNGTYYIVDPATRAVLAGPEDRRASLPAAGGGRGTTRVVEVPPGTVVVGAEATLAPGHPPIDSYYVLNDTVALTGRDVQNPQPSVDNPQPQAAGGRRLDLGPGDNGPDTGQPFVTFDLTPAGRAAFSRLIAQVARRGTRASRPGRPRFQHFAITLDGRLVTVPSIEYPNGIEATNGIGIGGGFTTASAQAFAATLRTGPLPVKLEAVPPRRAAP